MAYMGGSIPHIHRAKCCMPFSWVLLSPRHSRRCILSAHRPLITALYVSKYTGHRRSPLPKIIDHADLPAHVVSGPQIPGVNCFTTTSAAVQRIVPLASRALSSHGDCV